MFLPRRQISAGIKGHLPAPEPASLAGHNHHHLWRIAGETADALADISIDPHLRIRRHIQLTVGPLTDVERVHLRLVLVDDFLKLAGQFAGYGVGHIDRGLPLVAGIEREAEVAIPAVQWT